MGGGRRDTPETPKASTLVPLRSPEADGLPGLADLDVGQSHGTGDLDKPLCERTHNLAFRLFADAEVEAGEAVGVVMSSPPVLIAEGRQLGELSDRREAETISACLRAGYAIFGEVVAVDLDLREGFASVAGVRLSE